MPRSLCPRCLRPAGFCYCHLLPQVANRTGVLILQHREEAAHPLNTARIAALGLAQCRMVEVDEDEKDARWSQVLGLPQDIAPVLIYPGHDSIAFDASEFSDDTPLLFLDASWRKSRRMLLGSPWLSSLPCRHLVPRDAARYELRREPAPHCRSTLEAVVQALGMTGDDAGALLAVMDWMIARQRSCMPGGVVADE